MTNMGMDTLDRAVQKTINLINDIEKRLGWSGRKNEVYNLLRAILHALRDRLPIEDAVKFGAQLPMIVRGFFYEGWQPSKVPIKMDKEEFIKRIRDEYVFDTGYNTEELIKQTLEQLFSHINPHEAERIKQLLPKDLDEFFSLIKSTQ